MPKVAGTYQGIVRVKRIVLQVEAESKEAAIRMIIIALAQQDDDSDLLAWVNGGMEIELAVY